MVSRKQRLESLLAKMEELYSQIEEVGNEYNSLYDTDENKENIQITRIKTVFQSSFENINLEILKNE